MTTAEFVSDAIGHLDRARQQTSHSPETWVTVMDALSILDRAAAEVETDEAPTRDWAQYLTVTDWARQLRQQ